MRKIALRGLIGQKRNTLLLWSVVALSFLFLVLSTTLITSLQETDEQQRNRTYGSWQVMVADSALSGADYTEESMVKPDDKLFSSLSSVSDGSIILPMVKVSGIDYFSGDNEYYLTPYSDEFINTGYLTLKEGKWPSEKNEVALEYARLSSLNLKLGDSFTVVSQVNIPANDEYLIRLDEILEFAKTDIINEGKDIYQRKAWNDYNPSILNFNKKVYEEFFTMYHGQREGSFLAMVLADDEHPNGQIIPFDEMTEEQFITVYSVFVNSFSDTGTNITDYMMPHMTDEEISFYFGDSADLIGYENLNIRVTVNKRDIIVYIPYTYTVCGVIDTFSDRWDTGMIPLPSGFITDENYDIYINSQKKVLEKYDYFSFQPYNNLIFLSSNKSSPKDFLEECRNIVNSSIEDTSNHFAADFIENQHDLSELRFNRFAYPSSSEGSGQTLTLVTIILFVTTVCAVFQIFFTQMRKRLRRIILMKSIGAESGQIAKMLLWEFIYFWISTLPIGTLLGLGGAYIATAVLEKIQNRDIIYIIDPLIICLALFAGTFALFIGMVIPSIMAVGVPLTGRTARKKPLEPPKKEIKQTFLNITIRGLVANRNRTIGNASLCVFMMLITSLCIFIGFRFMTPYRETVERDNRPDYFLQLPYSASDRQLPEYLEELEALGVCESIEVQRTATDAVLSKDSVNSILLERAFENNLKIITDSFGAPDFEGYPIELYAVSSESEFFEKFNSATTVGSIDKEAFESGDEVLVMIPLYKDNGNGEKAAEGTGWDRVSSSGIDITFYEEYKNIYKKDDGLSVGDKITIGAQTRYVGGTQYDYKIVTDTAKVGAIIYYFPDEGIWPISGSDEGYQIVCSSKFAGHILPNTMRTRSSNEIRSFKIMYMSSGYGTTDFYINAKEGLSKYKVDTALLVYARSEYMDIEFYHESNEKLLQDAINNILLVCLLGMTAVLLALLIFANTITSDIEQERNKIGILQSLGVSNRQLIKRQLYIGLAVSGTALIIANFALWLGVAIYALLSDAVLGNLLWGYPWWLHISACILLALILTALYILPMRSIEKYLPIENIKTRK